MICVSCSMLETASALCVVCQAATALKRVLLPGRADLGLVLWERISSLLLRANPVSVVQRLAVPPHLFLSCTCPV